ncbi:MAG: LysR family transcriptional regulator [Verrucomicrobiae bacterium]|nr:LysR family transcriptional regulator [Verrucomicrobiae bacterium]
MGRSLASGVSAGECFVLWPPMPLGYTGIRMELRHLRYFVTVAEELNVSRASARLRISQPAVSRQLRDLEEELGVALFRREQHGLKLTPAGEAFLAHARDLLRRSGDAVKQMAAFSRPPRQTLTVGYIASVLPAVLTPALRRFSQAHVEVEVALRELSPGEQVKALRAGRIDLALLGSPCPEVEREFDVTVLKRVPFQAVLPDNHLLALRKRVALTELEDDAFIGFSEETFPGRNAAICAGCQAAGFTPRFGHYVENLTALLALVAAGKGVTLAPDEVSHLAHPQAVFVPLKPPGPSVVSVAARRQDDGNPLLKELLECCRDGEPAAQKGQETRGRRRP